MHFPSLNLLLTVKVWQKTLLILIAVLLPCNVYAESLNILIIGQSNAAGYARMRKYDKHVIKGAFLMKGKDKFVQAKGSLNKFSSLIGRNNGRLGFSHSLLENLSVDQNVFAIINARNGSSIECWSKGGGCYNKTLRRVRKSGVKIDVIFFHQGEKDREDENYVYRLANTITQWREELGDAGLPFICGQIAETVPFADEHNADLLGIYDLVDNVAVVSSEGLTTLDGWHFDNRGVKELGLRYYEAFEGLSR